MANVITLTDGTTTYSLLAAGSYRVQNSGIQSPPAPHVVTYGGSRHRDGQYPAFAHHDNQTWTLDAMIEGSTVDVLQNNFSNLQLMLDNATRFWRTRGMEGAQAVLKVQLNGATNDTQYVVMEGHVDPGDWGRTMTATTKVIFARVNLVTRPFGEETADVTASATNIRAAGDSWQIASVRGDAPTPVRFDFRSGTATGANRLIVGIVNQASASNVLPQLEGATGSYTGYNVVALVSTTNRTGTTLLYSLGSYGHFDLPTLGVTGAVRLVRFTLTANLHEHYGRWRVYGLICGDAATGVNLQLFYGPNTNPPNTAQDPTSYTYTSEWSVADLGTIEWPGAPLTAAASAAQLVMELAAFGPYTSGAGGLNLDHLLLFPANNYMDTSWNIGFSSGQGVVIDGMAVPPSVYTLDSSGAPIGASAYTPSRNSGTFPMLYPGNNRIVMYLENGTSSIQGHYVSATATYRPRYHFLRGS